MKLKLWIIIFLVLFQSSCSEHSAPEHITTLKILQVKLGMSRNEVIEILKEPVRKYSRGIHGGDMTFQFTEEQDYNYPMLWVHFDSLGVNSVYAKYYYWYDDRGIYGLSKNRETNEEFKWGEQVLEEYFN
ncbi:hypothetical protein [Seonamhaeicola maritimus]|uniref:hypothetical protein n=1 Tax=Seonamhaeicola maritimus TaxID=2591822 RepID=UPI002493DB7C|nr:hypothetical protein [Seonamhaeicola maritimus]